MDSIDIEAGSSLFDGKPFVTLRVESDGAVAASQMRPAKAREIALMLLECAEAATQDSVMYEFGRVDMGMDVEEAAKVIQLVRDRREKYDRGR